MGANAHLLPGDLVFEKISRWYKPSTDLGIVISMIQVNRLNYNLSMGYALGSREYISYVLFPDKGIKGPYLPGQLTKFSQTADQVH